MKIATKDFDIVADYDSFGYLVTETYYIMGVSIWLRYHYAPNGLAFAKIEEAIYVMSELEDEYELSLANYRENLILFVIVAVVILRILYSLVK